MSQAMQSEPLAERVYRHVSEGILNARWLSGDILDRKDIASELGVSLAPVSEALIRLDAEGFLETSPRRHTRVRVVRQEDVRGQLALRLALERQAAMMSHGQPVRDASAELLELAREVDSKRPKHPTSWPAEIAFHTGLVRLADCPALLAGYDRVMRRNYFCAINGARIEHLDKPASDDDHFHLIEALASDDPAEADRGVLDHYTRDVEHLLRPTVDW